MKISGNYRIMMKTCILEVNIHAFNSFIKLIAKKKAYKVIRDYFKDKPVKSIQVFGSFARGEQKEGSDIDILVELEEPVGLITFSGYRLDLEDRLGMDVDLGTPDGVSPHVKPLIAKELQTVYES